MASNPDDKKISQLPDNPVVLDADEFSTITPRTDGSVGFENVKTPAWKLKDYTSTDAHLKGVTTLPSGTRATPSLAHESDIDTGIHFPTEDTMALGTAGVETITIDPHNNTIIGPMDIVDTRSRDGFLYLPTMDGAPAALPRQIPNKTPIIIDKLNNVAFVFLNGAWRPLAGGTGGGAAAVIPTPVTRLDALDDVKATGASRPANGDALVYDSGSASWKPARSGLEITIRPDQRTAYPNPATLPVGHMILTIENGLKEIAVIDASHRISVLYSDSELAAKVAASSLFQGVKPDIAAIGTLPAPAPTNKGFYWTWTGPASTPVTPASFTNGGGFTATLQVGDWIQSDGVKFVHVPSDLMSKLRWKAVGSFQTWTNTNYEIDTLVAHNGRFYRATAAVTTGDPAPDAGGPWIDITPNYSISGLLDANLTTPPVTGDALIFDGVSWTAKRAIPDGFNDGDIISWDSTIKDWVTSADYLGDEENVDFAADPERGVPVYDNANNRFEIRKIKIEDLAGCEQLFNAENGDVPVWNETTFQWEPKKITSPIIYLGTGAWNAAQVNDPAHLYGMANDTVPSPAAYAPMAGDQYIDITTGQITAFSGAAPVAGTERSVSSITGGTSPASADLVPNKLASLEDVDLTTPPATDDVLTFDGTNWIASQPVTALAALTDVTITGTPADGSELTYSTTTNHWVTTAKSSTYTKTEVDNKIQTLVIGLEHGLAVQEIVNDPPTTPVNDEIYIVGASPTGAFVGQANNLATWDGTQWVFNPPQSREAHLIEFEKATYSWNGTSWVKVAVASTALATLGDFFAIGSIQQTLLTEAQFVTSLGADAGKWVLADGRNVTGSRWATITGTNTVPDLRGGFIRAAGQNGNASASWNGGTVGSFHEDTTRMPRNPFTTASAGDHTHKLYIGRYGGAGGSDVNNYNPGGRNDGSAETTTGAGAHTHTINGGDTFTAPVHYALNTYIKIN